MAAMLSADEPWPGLASFDEDDSGFFRGRAGETAELLRLVCRAPLTVLFGRSGLGKTSLLKAGLFPVLRASDRLPVYLRIDHAAAAPPPREQVRRALLAECAAHRVEAALPGAEAGLWAMFHRRDTEFWSARNRPVRPVLVFDQFEEVFTLGEIDEGARARSAAFLAELADLVEGRPPASVKEALEHDPAAASGYAFRRAALDIVLSFREDFLAEIEGLKARMPSLMQNRLRLLPMDGHQAHAVITGAGGALVDDAVARRILRLAWKNEPEPPVEPEAFGRLEIDPALLSVVCSELNHQRRAAGLERITPALLQGADRAILAGFYERALAGLAAPVRTFVEDELITDRGFRDSHDWDDALLLPGVDAAALELLIQRRLLRAEERHGRRRVELAHDVLTRVVMASRDRRRAREAEAALAAREAAALALQRRNRRIGGLVLAGIVLMLASAAGAGWMALRARDASKALSEAVVETRKVAQQAADAERRAAQSTAEAAEQQRLAAEATAAAQAERARADEAKARAAEAEAKAERQAEVAREETKKAEAAVRAAAESQKLAVGLQARVQELEQQFSARSASRLPAAAPAGPTPSGAEPPPAAAPAMTTAQLSTIMPRATPEAIALWIGPLNRAMGAYGITTPQRRAAFLAQVAHETGELRFLQELWGPTAAQLRYDPPGDLAQRLGNTEPGDGQRYRGRGLIQIAGRANYRRYGELLGLDLEGRPDQAATPEAASLIAALLWSLSGANQSADAGDFSAVTRRINGGLNGLADREAYYRRAKQAFGI